MRLVGTSSTRGHPVGSHDPWESDRVTAVVAVVGLLTLIGLLIWLMSMASQVPMPINTHWMMLP